jgi:hypothetical protein
VPGLNERPPHAEIVTRAFDTQLPNLDGGGTSPSGGITKSEGVDRPTEMSDGDDDSDSERERGGGRGDGEREEYKDRVGGGGDNAATPIDTSDEFSRERLLSLQHENSCLRAELASARALSMVFGRPGADDAAAAGAGDVAVGTGVPSATARCCLWVWRRPASVCCVGVLVCLSERVMPWWYVCEWYAVYVVCAYIVWNRRWCMRWWWWC